MFFSKGQTSEERKIERAEKENTLIRKVCGNCDVTIRISLWILGERLGFFAISL